MKRISLYIPFFILFAAVSDLYSAAASRRFALFPDEVEQDSLVSAILITSDIEDPVSFWEENVAVPLRVVEGVSREVLLGIAEGVKANILAGTIESGEIKDIVKNELEALAEHGVRIVRPGLPACLEKILESDPSLSEEARASISFQLRDQLDLGSPLVVLKSLAAELVRLQGVSLTEAATGRLDPRVYGLMRVATEGADPSLLIPAAPARWLKKKQRKSLVASLRSAWGSADTAIDIGTVPFALVPYLPPASGDGSIEKSNCTVCAQEEGEAVSLVRNVCSCKELPLCLDCVVQLTLKNIVAEIRLDGGLDGSPATLIFGLRIPSCPFCTVPYYTPTTLENLERALPVSKRKGIVLEALERELNKIPLEQRAIVIGRLVAANAMYEGIVTHRNSSTLLPSQLIAMQIFERDARMNEGIVAPFTESGIWKT